MQTVIVAGTGPSLSETVATQCQAHEVVAVNDAHRRCPWAFALYAADFAWWRAHDGVSSFAGRKLTCVCDVNSALDLAQLEAWGIESLSLDHGQSSLYGAISFAIQCGYSRIVLVGADLRETTPRHFFGNHPPGLRNTGDYGDLRQNLEALASRLPAGTSVLNATPDSALSAFPFIRLEDL